MKISIFQLIMLLSWDESVHSLNKAPFYLFLSWISKFLLTIFQRFHFKVSANTSLSFIVPILIHMLELYSILNSFMIPVWLNHFLFIKLFPPLLTTSTSCARIFRYLYLIIAIRKFIKIIKFTDHFMWFINACKYTKYPYNVWYLITVVILY